MSQSKNTSNENEDAMARILLDFFQNSTRGLEECTIARPLATINEIRSIILHEQTECLQCVVSDYTKDVSENHNDFGMKITVEQVQNALRDAPFTTNNPQLLQAMSTMDNAARFAFTRLVLQSEYYWEVSEEEKIDRIFNTSNPMKREDILEFCALCLLAVQLPNVQQHLLKGTPLFTISNEQEEQKTSSKATIFPDQRLHAIQQMILQALGYDPEHGKNELKRLFFFGTANEFSDDTEVMQTFNDMATAMNTTLTNITMQSTNELFLSDYNDGGCTRIVSVTYSEKVIGGNDPSLQNDVTDDTILPPISQVIENSNDSDDKRNTLRIAAEANRLQQEILGQLLLMQDDEREDMLQNAKQVSDQFLEQAMTIPSREDRIQFLQSIDEETKKLMMMHKLWEGMLAANNGKPPTIRYNNHSNI